MREIKRGTIISASFLRNILTKLFRRINEVDPSYITATTGQVVAESGTKSADMLSQYSDQYFRSDKMISPYAGELKSYLQRYIDELARLNKGV